MTRRASGSGPRDAADDDAARDRTRRVIDAVDRWELLALADTAELEGRPELATTLRLRLAGMYTAHEDFDRAWASDDELTNEVGSC